MVAVIKVYCSVATTVQVLMKLYRRSEIGALVKNPNIS